MVEATTDVPDFFIHVSGVSHLSATTNIHIFNNENVLAFLCYVA